MKVLSFYRSILLGSLITLATIDFGIKQAESAVLTDSEKNLELLAEAAISTHAMLTDTVGLSISKLNFSGNFDDSGWSLNLNSNSPKLPIDLSFTGSFNPTDNTGAFNSTGSIGTSSWLSSGDYTFTEISESNLFLNYNSQAQIIGGNIIFPFPFIDFKTEKFNVPGPNNTVQDIGQVTFTIAGVPIKTEVVQDSIHFKEPGTPELCSLTTTIEGISTLITGNSNCDGGSVTGNVMSVPEPTSILSLLVLGTLGAGSILKRKQKFSKSTEKELEKIS